MLTLSCWAEPVTKCPGSKAAGIAMAYKLIEAAQARWRAVNAPQLVALVRAGARFEHGKLVEREPTEVTPQDAPATKEEAAKKIFIYRSWLLLRLASRYARTSASSVWCCRGRRAANPLE